MRFNSIGASLLHGAEAIWYGGVPTRAAFVVGAILVVFVFVLLYQLAQLVWRHIRRRRIPESFLISGTEASQWISVSTGYLESTKDALSKMRTGQQIVLETTGLLKQTVRGKLQRRTAFARNELGVSKRAFEDLTGQQWTEGTPRGELKLFMRPGYSLWNHPDDAIRISTRVTFWVTLINVVVAFVLGTFFWWLPH
jgi:hypothetical protein